VADGLKETVWFDAGAGRRHATPSRPSTSPGTRARFRRRRSERPRSPSDALREDERGRQRLRDVPRKPLGRTGRGQDDPPPLRQADGRRRRRRPLRSPGGAELVADYFNADGGAARFCANGTRCAARLASVALGLGGDFVVVTGWGRVGARVAPEGRVTLTLPEPVRRAGPSRRSVSAEEDRGRGGGNARRRPASRRGRSGRDARGARPRPTRAVSPSPPPRCPREPT